MTEICLVDSETGWHSCRTVREVVFVQEQKVPLELEMDEYDAEATHFLVTDGGAPVGTARLVNKHGVAKIGRVALLQSVRGRGIGLRLMQAVIDEARTRGFSRAMLDSQTYAVPFYERLGFVAEGPEFDDAGIPHRHMTRDL